MRKRFANFCGRPLLPTIVGTRNPAAFKEQLLKPSTPHIRRAPRRAARGPALAVGAFLAFFAWGGSPALAAGDPAPQPALVAAVEADPISAENAGLLSEERRPGSESSLLPPGDQSLISAPLPGPLPGPPPLAPPGHAVTLRLPGLSEAPPKATDIPEFPTLEDLEVEARLERLSQLPPSSGLNIVRTGLTQKGRRYRWGGTYPSTGFDCSGFTQWTFAQHGIKLPRTAQEQYHGGKKVKRADLRPGDLVFYRSRHGLWHVGIYMDDGVFVHSPRRGRSISEGDMTDPYWAQRYVGARRYAR